MPVVSSVNGMICKASACLVSSNGSMTLLGRTRSNCPRTDHLLWPQRRGDLASETAVLLAQLPRAGQDRILDGAHGCGTGRTGPRHQRDVQRPRIQRRIVDQDRRAIGAPATRRGAVPGGDDPGEGIDRFNRQKVQRLERRVPDILVDRTDLTGVIAIAEEVEQRCPRTVRAPVFLDLVDDLACRPRLYRGALATSENAASGNKRTDKSNTNSGPET